MASFFLYSTLLFYAVKGQRDSFSLFWLSKTIVAITNITINTVQEHFAHFMQVSPFDK